LLSSPINFLRFHLFVHLSSHRTNLPDASFILLVSSLVKRLLPMGRLYLFFCWIFNTISCWALLWMVLHSSNFLRFLTMVSSLKIFASFVDICREDLWCRWKVKLLKVQIFVVSLFLWVHLNFTCVSIFFIHLLMPMGIP